VAVPKWGSPSSENSSGVPSWGRSEGKPQWGNSDKQGASWGRGAQSGQGASPATPAPTPASATPQEPETQGSGNSNNRPDNGKKGKGSKNTPHSGIHMTTGKLVAVILVVAALIAGGMVAYSSLHRSSEPTQQQTQNANKPVIVGEDKSGSKSNSDTDADKNTQESEEYSKSLEKDRQSAIQDEANKRLTEGDSQGAEYMRELKDSGIKNIDNNIPSPAKEKVTKAIQALANGSCKDASDVLGGVLSCTSDDFTKFDAGKVTVNNGVTNDSGVKTYTITFPDNAGSAVVSLNSSNSVTSFMLANALTPLPDGYGD
jgi:hypothetical protein